MGPFCTFYLAYQALVIHYYDGLTIDWWWTSHCRCGQIEIATMTCIFNHQRNLWTKCWVTFHVSFLVDRSQQQWSVNHWQKYSVANPTSTSILLLTGPQFLNFTLNYNEANSESSKYFEVYNKLCATPCCTAVPIWNTWGQCHLYDLQIVCFILFFIWACQKQSSITHNKQQSFNSILFRFFRCCFISCLPFWKSCVT